jgi:N6-adenosine-specific RNA methylase IME4
MSGELLPPLPKRGAKIAERDVEAIEERIAENVGHLSDIAEALEWRDQAKALEHYLRGKGMSGPMTGAQRRVEARIGQLLGEAKPGPSQSSVVGEVSSKDDRADFRILAHAFNGCELTASEWRKSRRSLVALIRRRTGNLPPPPKLPDGIFRVIVVDPPWPHDTGPEVFGGAGEEGHDALAYPQMPVEAIKEMAVKDHVADDAHLYLWTTNRYVERAYEVVRAWGFKPSVLLVWAKTPRGVGLGDAFRLTTEFILYARRGSLKELDVSDTTWFNWPRGRHSAKPDAFYELVERISPAAEGDRLEMFAREPRDGWMVGGDEVDALGG